MTSKNANRVLVVDGEPLILRVYESQLSRFYYIATASSGNEALQLLHDRGPFAVLITDMQLPDMEGIHLLNKVRQTYPDTVRVMLTASSRQEVVAQAINEGGIFQFLNKPCTSERLAKTIEHGIERYHRTLIEKQFLTGAVNAAIQIQLDFLEMMNIKALEKSRRVEKVVRYVVDHLSPPNGWMINLAARLSQVGAAVPADRAGGLSPPELGAKLLGRLSQLREIVELIRLQRAPLVAGTEFCVGKRILPVVLQFDDLLEAGDDPLVAVAKMSESLSVDESPIVDQLAQYVYAISGIAGGDTPPPDGNVTRQEAEALAHSTH